MLVYYQAHGEKQGRNIAQPCRRGTPHTATAYLFGQQGPPLDQMLRPPPFPFALRTRKSREGESSVVWGMKLGAGRVWPESSGPMILRQGSYLKWEDALKMG